MRILLATKNRDSDGGFITGKSLKMWSYLYVGIQSLVCNVSNDWPCAFQNGARTLKSTE